MIDALCVLGLLAFLGALIWSTVMRAPKSAGAGAASAPQAHMGPVILSCSICHAYAATVLPSEYERISRSGEAVYCPRCMQTISVYRRQTGERQP